MHLLEVSYGTVQNLEKRGLLPRQPNPEYDKKGVYYSYESVRRAVEKWRPTRATKSMMRREAERHDRGKAASAVFTCCMQGMNYQEIVVVTNLDPIIVKQLIREYYETPAVIESELDNKEAREEHKKKRGAARSIEREAQRHKHNVELEKIKQAALIEAEKIKAGMVRPRIGSLLQQMRPSKETT